MQYRILGPLLVLLLVFSFGCSKGKRHPNIQFPYQNMDQSKAFEAYSENPLFKDGKTMQLPAKGTVARGHMPYPYPKSPEGMEKAEKELTNPYTKTADNLSRGKEVYQSFCMPCHGNGDGKGPVTHAYPPPPSLFADYMKAYTPGRIYHVVTVGSAIMPGYQGQISAKDRWLLVQYVKELQSKN